jgi:hypothetical protein
MMAITLPLTLTGQPSTQPIPPTYRGVLSGQVTLSEPVYALPYNDAIHMLHYAAGYNECMEYLSSCRQQRNAIRQAGMELISQNTALKSIISEKDVVIAAQQEIINLREAEKPHKVNLLHITLGVIGGMVLMSFL